MSPSSGPLERRIAIVTGASSGIGQAAAIAVAGAGATVVVNYHGDEAGANATVEAIARSGGQAVPVRADVSQEADVIRLFREAIERFGTVHLLVNNAGLQRDAPIREMTLDDWRTVIDVNLTGQFLCAREAIREFCRRGVDATLSTAAGNIICMSSVHQVIPWAGHANYAASKGGVQLLMESLAQEVAADRIRVNAIAPGAIRTPINRAAGERPKDRAALERLIPYGRLGTPEDVAQAVVWLASDASDYVTGTSLVVDGGMLLYPGFRSHG